MSIFSFLLIESFKLLLVFERYLLLFRWNYSLFRILPCKGFIEAVNVEWITTQLWFHRCCDFLF